MTTSRTNPIKAKYGDSESAIKRAIRDMPGVQWDWKAEDHKSLSQRCRELMQTAPWFVYEGMIPEHLEGVYIERTYNLAIVDKYIELCKDAPRVVKMLQELRREIERE